MEYLTEQSLKPILETKFENIITQYTLSNRKRVDFYMPDDKLIVEFDGNRHYQEYKTMDRDIKNQALLLAQEIRVVHIPYWVQAEFVMPFYFGILDYRTPDGETAYPNGFVDKNCVRPSDFSFLGWERFLYELNSMPTPIREEIHKTMTDYENYLHDHLWDGGRGNSVLYDELCWMDGCMFG